MVSHVHGHSLRLDSGAWFRGLFERRDGKISIIAVLLILVAAGIVYTAVLFIPPYIEYYKLEEKVRSVANQAHREKDDDALQKELIRESQILELDLPYDAFSIKRDPQGKWIEFDVHWARVVNLVPFGQDVTMHFDIQVVEQF
jgi:hypothetical protein